MDIAHYRRSETLARQFMPSWRLAQAHSPHVFRAVGFPVQVESTADLVPLLDTMQEDRFLPYQEELGGLTEGDFDRLTSACADFALFAQRAFHNGRVELPLATLTAHYALATKLCGWQPPAKLVLEIGPGSGYLSFFADFVGFDTYVQVETTESFYILQHLVNAFCFRGDVDEHAIIDSAADYVNCAVPPEMSLQAVWVKGGVRCAHLPWWRIGDVRLWRSYDIVTTNANLTEFSDAAFSEYANLIRAVLKPTGMLLMQDFGGGPADVGERFDYLRSIGFAPLVLVDAGTSKFGPVEKHFATPNAVFVREGHPRFSALDQRANSLNIFAVSDPAVRRMFRLDDIGPRRNYSPDEFVDRVTDALGGS